jgi:hypothetical protein
MMPSSDGIQANPQIAAASKGDARCWKGDARAHVSRLGWSNDPHANVKVTYNSRSKTCVVEIVLRVVRDGRTVMLSRSIGSIKGREYAHFIWKTGSDFEEAPAIFCEVFLSSGEQLECHSEAEFDEVVSSLLP